MSEPELTKITEAVLFAADAPVSLDKLSDIIDTADRKQIREALKELGERYDAEGRAFALQEVAGGWQIYCRPEYSKWVKELHRGRIPTRLSQAALETLAIVAYKQPIVRAEIETIRGVDSSGVLATLMRRDLITIAGRAPGMGRALMYRTTKEFLRYFGLNFVTDLPRLEEFAEVLGLKPGEMELAVEGAESVAEVQAAPEDGNGIDGGNGADGGNGSDAGNGNGGEEYDYEIEGAPDPDFVETLDADGVTEPPERPVVDERIEGGPEEDVLPTDAAPPPDVPNDTHVVPDRRLIDEIDET